MERNIRISNMPKGQAIDSAAIQIAIDKTYDKLSQRFAEPVSMEIHFKEGHVQRKKDGQKEQTEAHVKAIIGGGASLLHAKHVEWNAAKAVKGALNAVEKEASKALGKK